MATAMTEPDYNKDVFVTEQPESLGDGFVVHRGDGSPAGIKLGRFSDRLAAETIGQREANAYRTALWFSTDDDYLIELR